MNRNVSVIAVLLAFAIPVAGAAAGEAPPAPVAANGNPVKLHASGVPVPTQITFGGGNTFVAGAEEGPMKGGLFVVKPGKKAATKVPGTPSAVFGVLWHSGTLYATQGTDLVAYRKWNGKRFEQKRRLVKGPKTGFSGLAMGPNGRLYTGVQLKQAFDHKANPMKYANTVVSVKTSGKGFRVESTGIRQPWMLAFAKGEKSPIVSNLAQDLPEGVKAPDSLLKAKPGTDFGFPGCNWEVPADCDGFAKPFLFFDALHASPMGLAADGKKLYVALFGGLGDGPEVVTTNSSGAVPKTFVSGFGPAPILSVALHGGHLYIGGFAGIFRVKV